MSGDEVPSDDAIASLLKSERQRTGPDAATKQLMWSGVEQGLAGPADPSRPGPSPAKSAVGKAASTALGWKMAGLAAAAALAGGAAGAWIHARVAEPRIVVVERPSPAPVVAPAVTSSAGPIDSTAPAAQLPATTAKAAATAAPPRVVNRPPVEEKPQPSHDVPLARERSLLDMGRTALARGDTESAFRAVKTLEQEAPNGQLVEEREVLAVQTLVTANRTAEARRRAAQFRMKYPSSPLLGVVDDAVSP